MTIKKISLRKEFLNQENLRLDPYYYILSNVIKLMSSVEGVVNKTIKEAGIKVSSGSYVRDYESGKKQDPFSARTKNQVKKVLLDMNINPDIE